MTPTGIVSPQQLTSSDTPETRGDAYRKQGQLEQAIRCYLEAVTFPLSRALLENSRDVTIVSITIPKPVDGRFPG